MPDPLDQSLEELEADHWAKPEWQSGLVLRVHQLRKKPLRQLSIGELQLLIGQQIGLEHLVPIALKHLQANPLIEGDYYPGDLLHSVVSVDSPNIERNISLYRGVLNAVQSFKPRIADEELLKELESFEMRFSMVTKQR